MTPAELANLHARCFVTPRPWRAEEFASLLSGANVFDCTVAHGFVLGRVIMDEAEMLTLAVDPDHRRGGSARQLMAAFENEARIRGAVTAFLEVSTGNHAAIALYEACGYKQSGLRKGYYQAPDGQKLDAQVMTRLIG